MHVTKNNRKNKRNAIGSRIYWSVNSVDEFGKAYLDVRIKGEGIGTGVGERAITARRGSSRCGEGDRGVDEARG
jgi:hypothetical protein